MTITEAIAWITAIAAVIAVFFNGVQTKKLIERHRFDQEIARGNAVIHFTGRFFDLLREGGGEELKAKIKDPNWAYQFWSLHATEFFFFQHGILPKFMYGLWMIDLADVYSSMDGDAVYISHRKYLHTYSFNYPDMIEFFDKIHDLAIKHSDENLRNRQVWNYLEEWVKTHIKSIEQ